LTFNPNSQQSIGFLAKLRSRLSRGGSWLAGDIGGVLRNRRLDEETLDALEEQLLVADVGPDATDWILRQLRGTPDADPQQLLCRAVETALQAVAVPLAIDSKSKPFVILTIGVNGTGKTTTIGKLAHHLKLQGRSVLLAAGDTFRAAAVEQLEEWGRRANVPVVSQASGADPAAVVHDALHAARARNIDVVIADTAGRLHTATGLMDELDKIRRVVTRFDASAPHEVLLVLDASQGQNALAQATQFHDKLGVTGLVLTKLDGTAKGGIALAIAHRLRVPFRFVAVGEAIEDFGTFDARIFAAALTGAEAS